MGKVYLNQYIASVRGQPFEWGVFDCYIFSNSAFKAYWGFGYADDWQGGYLKPDGPMKRDDLRKKFGYMRLEQALDDRLERCSANIPGALVTTKNSDRWITGVALGISVGSRCIFVAKQGMVMLSSSDANAAWKPK